jgi:hypothetical protein
VTPLPRTAGTLINDALNCAVITATPYSLSAALCDDTSSFKALDYFATLVCGTLVPTLNQWAAAMFALVATGFLASFSGCCLDGCCQIKKSFDTSVAPIPVSAVQIPQAVAP